MGRRAELIMGGGSGAGAIDSSTRRVAVNDSFAETLQECFQEVC